MESPASTSAALLRPRFAIALVSAVTALSLGVYLYRETSSASSAPASLHRSNAVRRRRPPPRRRAASIASTTSVESHEDVDTDNDRENRLEIDGEENRDLHLRGDAETIAEEIVTDWWEDPQDSQPPERAGQNIVGLLFRVSEDNARRNAYVHRGCACNACGIVPIRGVRYRCSNCADFDLCETCESQGLHIKTHIFYKIKVPAPPFGPRPLQPVVYSGDPDSCPRSLPRDLMIRLSRETGFERPELETFWEQWTFIANTEWREDPDDMFLAMDRKTFEGCLVPPGGHKAAAPNLIHDRMFAFYDTNKDDLISFSEFLHGLAYRKRPDKLRRIFEGYDVDGDGFVDRRDFLRLFRAYYVQFKQMHRSILENLQDQVLNTTEAHQLVNSRQPLSSFFGREGPIPDADQDRVMEGKVFHHNGDVALVGDRTQAVNGDSADTSGREEILTNLFSRSHHQQPFFMEPMFFLDESTAGGQPTRGGNSTDRYADALLNPPRNIEELQSVITDEPRNTLDSFLHVFEEREREALGSSDSTLPTGNGESSSRNGQVFGAGAGTNNAQLPGPLRRLLGDDDDARPSHYSHDTDAHDERMRARNTKRTRIFARKKLHERWKRRQFYLDEEEGAHPPDDWNPADDILASSSATTHGEQAGQDDDNDDDDDDDDNGSGDNGNETHGAERDAGKEILYQVTQQAFNELLDVLFKAKEDLAVKAASTRADRQRYRKYFEHINLDEEEEEDDEDGEEEEEDDNDGDDEREQGNQPATASSVAIPEDGEAGQNSDEQAVEDLPQGVEKEGPVESLPADGEAVTIDEGIVQLSSPGRQYFDPTMPQFRPNSNADIPLFNAARSMAICEDGGGPAQVKTNKDDENDRDDDDDSAESTSAEDAESIAERENQEDGGGDDEDGAHGLTPYMLREWKRLDMAEAEQRERGGWGKLSYEEFEEIYRREERHSNRLDYLGSWIDVCIPYS